MFEPGIRPVAIFTVSYLLLASFFAYSTGNWEFLFYVAVVLLLIAFVMGVHRYVHFTVGTLWALSVWGLLHMLGGMVPLPEGVPYLGKPVLYSMWLVPYYIKYDMVIHAFGFGVATFACWQASVVVTEQEEVKPGRVILAVLAGMGLGAANEVIEFFAVLLLPDTNVGGYENTGWDLVFNAIGSVIAGLYILRSWEPERKYLRELIQSFKNRRQG